MELPPFSTGIKYFLCLLPLLKLFHHNRVLFNKLIRLYLESVPLYTRIAHRKFKKLGLSWMLGLFMEIDGALPLEYHTRLEKEVEKDIHFRSKVSQTSQNHNP